jgi:hypothetical protein
MNNDDLGLNAVRRHFQIAGVDEKWSVWTGRGYRWWSCTLAQDVWSEPPRQENGEAVWILRAKADLLREVKDTPQMRLNLAILNASTPLNALVYDPVDRSVRLSCSIPLTETNQQWAVKTFSWAAATQAEYAFRLLATDVTSSLGGKFDITARPGSGPRSNPDEMLTVIEREMLRHGQGPSPFGEADFRSLKELAGSPSVMTSASSTGVTAEFLFGGYSGLLQHLFGPNGKPNTALLKMTSNDPHPGLGCGCMAQLFLPLVVPTQEVADLANRLNLAEATQWQYLYGLGAWGLVRMNDMFTGLCHTTFLPAVLQTSGILTNFFWCSYHRMAWAKKTLQLEAPPPPQPQAANSSPATDGKTCLKCGSPRPADEWAKCPSCGLSAKAVIEWSIDRMYKMEQEQGHPAFQIDENGVWHQVGGKPIVPPAAPGVPPRTRGRIKRTPRRRP